MAMARTTTSNLPPAPISLEEKKKSKILSEEELKCQKAMVEILEKFPGRPKTFFKQILDHSSTKNPKNILSGSGKKGLKRKIEEEPLFSTFDPLLPPSTGEARTQKFIEEKPVENFQEDQDEDEGTQTDTSIEAISGSDQSVDEVIVQDLKEYTGCTVNLEKLTLTNSQKR